MIRCFWLCALFFFSSTSIAKEEKNVLTLALESVVEIVTLKEKDSKMKFDRELPLNKLPFHIRNDKYRSHGTAFFINKRDLVSAAHVFHFKYARKSSDWFIRTANGEVHRINRIKKFSDHSDLIVVSLKSYPKAFNPLKLQPNFKVGEKVCAPGNALGQGIAIRCDGRISSTTPEDVLGEWKDIRFSTPASPGNSGGPLMNEKGEVVGVITKKSQGENLNVATPVDQIALLPKFARFFDPTEEVTDTNLGFYYRKTMDIRIPLPLDPASLRVKSSQAYSDFIGEMFEGFEKKYADKIFPKDTKFRNFLQVQTGPLSEFSKLKSVSADSNSWHYSTLPNRCIQISSSRQVCLSKLRSDFLLTLDKPEDVTISKFLEDGRKIMSTFAKTLGIGVPFGSESVKIVDSGEPELAQEFRDNLGRRWKHWLWKIEYSNTDIDVLCLPLPGKVACYMKFSGKGFRIQENIEILKRSTLSEIIIMYGGSIDNWRDYLKSEAKWIPSFIKISGLKSGVLRIPTFPNLKGISKDNGQLLISFGYDPKEEIGLTPIGVDYVPDLNESNGFSFKKMFKPKKENGKEAIASYKKITSKTGLFSGKIHTEGGTLTMNQVFIEKDKAILASCYMETTNTNSKVKEFCSKIEYTN